MNKEVVCQNMKSMPLWTKFDLAKGFLQIPLHQGSQKFFGFMFDNKFF